MQHVALVSGDEELLAGARAGDVVCFERLIEPQIALGYRLAAAMLNDAGQAEDAVQDATLRAWRSIRQLRSTGKLKGWYLTIIANRCRSMRGTRWWSVIRVADTGSSFANPADDADQRHDLSRGLARLSPEERAVIFLRFYEGLTSREVGEALGITATAARSRIHRALQRLRVDLAEEDL